jgi:hypothetical protein
LQRGGYNEISIRTGFYNVRNLAYVVIVSMGGNYDPYGLGRVNPDTFQVCQCDVSLGKAVRTRIDDDPIARSQMD